MVQLTLVIRITNMHFYIITIFPHALESFLKTSLIARGIKKKIISLKIHNLRDWAYDKHKSVDDRPYGGGPGMVLRVDVMDRAIKSVKSKTKSQRTKVILLTPQGKPFTAQIAQQLSSLKSLVLITGHYEGYDERIRDLADEEISIGDYVLTGGELPAMVVIDAVSRFVPGFLGKKSSLAEESFGTWKLAFGKLLEYPQYTRPADYKGKLAPAVLLSGDHKKIKNWRLEQAIKRTKQRRSDLIT